MEMFGMVRAPILSVYKYPQHFALLCFLHFPQPLLVFFKNTEDLAAWLSLLPKHYGSLS